MDHEEEFDPRSTTFELCCRSLQAAKIVCTTSDSDLRRVRRAVRRTNFGVSQPGARPRVAVSLQDAHLKVGHTLAGRPDHLQGAQQSLKIFCM